jgi:phage shock protein PspC (stress-responsive transcriptional regulator)
MMEILSFLPEAMFRLAFVLVLFLYNAMLVLVCAYIVHWVWKRL